jgi:tetratricopeptide (TPR) repeat protein
MCEAPASSQVRRSLLSGCREYYPAGQVRAMWWLGASAYYTGDHAACLDWWLKALRISPARISGSLVRRSMLFVAIALAANGEVADAQAHSARALSLARQAGAVFDEADALISLANVSLLLGHLPEARTYLSDAAELTGRIGNDLLVFDTGHGYAGAVTVQ